MVKQNKSWALFYKTLISETHLIFIPLDSDS